MSQCGKIGRKRAPLGFYSDLATGRVKTTCEMAENSKGKTRPKSKASSKKSVGSRKAEGTDLSQEEDYLEKEIEDLEGRDAHSKVLHEKLLKGEIQFVEDIELPENLEDDDVWKEEIGKHGQEEAVIQHRMTRLTRKQELMAQRQRIREQRLILMKEEKALEMEEKKRQIAMQKEWLRLQQEDKGVEREWKQAQEELEEFHKNKRLEGWVEETKEYAKYGEAVRSEKLGKVSAALAAEKTEGARKKDPRSQMLASEAKRLQQGGGLETGPLTGVQHLKRMGILPSYGMTMEGDASVLNLPSQGGGATGQMVDPWEHLSVKGETGKSATHMQVEDLVVGEKMKDGDKNKIKSGKFAKSHTQLVREESWPHLNVLRQYGKRCSFEQMDYETFVAGESRVVLSMMRKNTDRALGRLKVLCKVAHWMCKCRDWVAVKNIYEAIIESVELGETEWTHNFEAYESLLPPPPAVLDRLRQRYEGKDPKESKDKEVKKVGDVFWCKDFQKGNCQETGPHMAQLKPEEKPVMVVHICATCWQKDKKKRDHQDGDSVCPHRKA